MVLKDYENEELYEECAIIRDALIEFRDKYSSKFPKGLKFPTSVEEYQSKECQDVMKKLNIEEKSAKEKATLIKLNLPVKDGL